MLFRSQSQIERFDLFFNDAGIFDTAFNEFNDEFFVQETSCVMEEFVFLHLGGYGVCEHGDDQDRKSVV